MQASSSLIENPQHSLSAEVAAALKARQAAHQEMLDLHNEIVRTSEVNEEYANARREVLSSILQPLHANGAEVLSRLAKAQTARDAKFTTSLHNLIDLKRHRYANKLSDLNVRPLRPDLTDHNFWWANTHWWSTSGHTFDFRSDGLHCFGGPKIDKWNADRHENFGAIARFALQHDRIPASASGRWTSNPFVELFGGLEGFAPDYDWLQGHGMASCERVLRQTLFQWGFGPDGPVPMILAEAVNVTTLLNLEDLGASRTVGMPGHLNIPSLQFGKSDIRGVADPIWAEIEVRFDIYLKQAGALVWCNPEVLLRNFQWPLEPL